MPELPEVQTVVNDLNHAQLTGIRITGVDVHWPRMIEFPAIDTFKTRLVGRKIHCIRRRGKFIVLDLDQMDRLLIHLRMSGRLRLISQTGNRDPHEHVIVTFSDQRQLRMHDTRKFGRWRLEAGDEPSVLDRLGPEPLAKPFTAKILAESLHRRHRKLKPLLLDQSFIAGLGNIYVDEALWQSRLHPCCLSDTLGFEQVKSLHRAIRRVLRCAIANMGTSLGAGKANFYSVPGRLGKNRDQLNVFRQTGLPCPRCNQNIIRLVVGQRGTHICPECQKTT